MANGFHEDETTGALSWFEPIPAVSTEPSYGIQYTEIPSDHLETLYEVVERDGVTWHLARAIISQPYHSLHFESDKLKSMCLKVDRLDDRLSWYEGRPTAVYVYQPVYPVPFDLFRKTFRYWLITRVGPQRSFPDNFLPTVFTPPELFRHH
jgi:MoaA/NifB/PqqE/SkfB family radical SAM enzyme